MTGTIRTLRVDKGFGFIKDEAGKEYFFHQSAVYGEGLDNLREGDSVEFDVGQGPKGPRAENVRRTSTEKGRPRSCGRYSEPTGPITPPADVAASLFDTPARSADAAREPRERDDQRDERRQHARVPRTALALECAPHRDRADDQQQALLGRDQRD